jgi:SPW repeat-containing protein
MKHIIGLNVILGVWLIVSPFAFGYDTASTAAIWNDVVVGLAIIGCAWCVVAEVPGSALCSGCSVLCGAWLLVAPFVLNYRLVAFGNDVIIGALALAISAIETWRLTHRAPRVAD